MSQPAKKSPAKKSPAKKSPAKKSPAKKSPAKKSPAKKDAAPPRRSPAAESTGEGAPQLPPHAVDDRGPASEPSWKDLGWDDDAWASDLPSDEHDGPDARGWWSPGGTSNEGLELLHAAARDAIVAARALLDVAEELIDDPAALGATVTSLRNVAGGLLRGTAGRDRRPGGRDVAEDDPEGYERIDLD